MSLIVTHLKKLAEVDQRIDNARFLLSFKERDRTALVAALREELGRNDARLKFIDFDARREPSTSLYCPACQKDLTQGQAKRSVLLVLVGSAPFSLHPDDFELVTRGVLALPENAELKGYRPIGADCARRHGAEWLVPTPRSYFDTSNAN